MKNTACDEIDHAVSKLAVEEGEEWRLKHAELMDSYQAHHNEQESVDAVSAELLADAHPDFDSQTIKVRCVSCQKEIETKLRELKMKFSRGSNWFVMDWQGKIHIPFTKFDIILSLFSTERRYIK